MAVPTATNASAESGGLTLGGTAITLPRYGRRLWAPAGFPAFTAGVCRTWARPSSASSGRDITKARSVANDFRLAGQADDQAGHISTSSPVGAFDDLGTMLDQTKPDVVHVCSPHGFHAADAIETVKRGIKVIIEKPMASDEADAQALIAAAKDTGVHAAVCFTKRSYPMVADLRAQILAGELGQVNAIRGGFMSWDSNHGNWGWGVDPKIAGTSYATADLGVHWLDLAEHVTDRRITEVAISSPNRRYSKFFRDKVDGHLDPCYRRAEFRRRQRNNCGGRAEWS